MKQQDFQQDGGDRSAPRIVNPRLNEASQSTIW